MILTFTVMPVQVLAGQTPGGHQLCFKAAGAPSKYRLGNECDTYAELKLGANLFDQDSVQFYWTPMSPTKLHRQDDMKPPPAVKELISREAKGVFGDALPKAQLFGLASDL